MIRCLSRIKAVTSEKGSRGTGLIKRSFHTSHIRRKDGIAAEADVVEKYLEDFTQRLQSDASSRILASPLRRCSVTQVMLPRLLMFRMTSSRPLKSMESEEAEVDEVSLDDLDIRGVENNREKENLLLRRRSRRWLLKEKKKSKMQLLLRAQRMAQHKLVTSQTDLSRDRFRVQIAAIKARINKLSLPRPLGHLLPFGLSREAERRSCGTARGRGLWCSLNKRIVAASTKMTTYRMIPHTHPAPDNLPHLLQEGLEIRAIEEARLLLQELTVETYENSIIQGSLIRRLRGQEVRSVVENSKGMLKKDNDMDLACLLCSNGSITGTNESPPIYKLDTIIVDDSRRTSFQSILREIAILINKKQLRLKRRLKQTNSNPSSGSSANRKTIEAGNNFKDGQKMPRLHLIKRDKRTVNLCIALWRLNAWCQSG